MSKRQMQERKQGGEDEREVAKSKPARNLVSKALNRSPTALSSSSSQSPGTLQQIVQTLDSFGMEKPVAMDSNKDNAPGSQVWHADAYPNSSTGILVA